MNHTKYAAFPRVALKRRAWPDKTIERAPLWCSVDLRDGNQALPTPMNLQQKMELFELLVRIGFKEIEVGFPAAADVEYDFVRHLIEHDLIPDDVTIQVLTQAREHLIEKTCKALCGVKKATIHLYNSTSELQRRVVFGKGRDEIKEMAVEGTRLVRRYRDQYLADSTVGFEYSPESFMGTELDYAVEICTAVFEAWGDTSAKPIINLPSTVEVTTPNVWADQIEWFCHNFKYRNHCIMSVHCHNDRGTGVAATELAILAGADRVEGTLFGNGERTGNVDLLTLALNLYTQGVDPRVDVSQLNAVREVYERCTGMKVAERHPYSGELVFTAFSGSHQDAINKGMCALLASGTREEKWEVPYLPIDPKDIGRDYEPIIRINSQSGKGGVAFILEHTFGFRLPKAMHPEFASVVQAISEKTAQEVAPSSLWAAFSNEYLEHTGPLVLREYEIQSKDGTTRVTAELEKDGEGARCEAEGNRPIDAFMRMLREQGYPYMLVSYEEHALEKGSDAHAVAYVCLEDGEGARRYGVGMDANIVTASFQAVISAVNRHVCATAPVYSASSIARPAVHTS